MNPAEATSYVVLTGRRGLRLDTGAVVGATAACEQKHGERVGEVSKHETERTLATWRRRSSSRPCGRRSAGTAAGSQAFAPTISRRSPSPRRSSAPASTRREIEDVYLGCANQAGEDNRNVARMAALLAGLPESVAGVTVNRLCASGLSAVVGACHAIAAGDGDLFVAGGVESMSRAPLVTAKPDAAYPRGDRTMYDTTLGWRFPNPALAEKFPLETMGETGENVAERWDVSREDQDAFALRSQQRWANADFSDELVPVGELERDEHPRPDTSAEKLAGSEAGVPRRTAPSRRATRAGSTTAPPRS